MNYGFAYPGDSEVKPPELEPGDEPDRLCIQLYHKVVSPVPLDGLEVLEVGSGRGGGCSYIARYLGPAQVTGIDFSQKAVAFSQKRHQQDNLRFSVGDAEALPFPDSSFDIVLNVESSHCYGDVPRFFSEVARVLRPDGHFFFADLRETAEIPPLKQELAAGGVLEIFQEENITAQVTGALSADHNRKRELIAKLAPPRMVKTFGEFAGLEGSQIFETLSKGSLLYYRFAARKTLKLHA